MHGQQNDKYTEMHGRQNVKIFPEISEYQIQKLDFSGINRQWRRKRM